MIVTFTIPAFILITLAIVTLGIAFGVWLALNKVK
jgi:hypothetical protein